ncbi:MAG: protein kinase [Planctomycetaceae bacterium]
MHEDASNSELLAAWRQGDENAAQVLVRRYMTRLTALARVRLSRRIARRLDSEDIVMSAWRSFFSAAGRNQVEVPSDDDLWPLLVTMTIRKLSRQVARNSAARRSLSAETEIPAVSDWPEVVSRDPTPDDAALVADEIEVLMAGLSSMDRDILTRRLQGDHYAGIAKTAGCSERTVRRSLQRIRKRYLEGQQSASENRACDPPPVADSAAGQRLTPDPVAQPTERKTVAAGQHSLFQGCTRIPFSEIVLEELIGHGAFGRVYRTRHLSDGTTVAVKFLRKHLWQDSVAASQLIREVSIVSSLSHPGIIRHSGWGRTNSGAVFNVMEFVDGGDLETWTRSQPSLRDILECGIAICDAVETAHRGGVVHADLTPRNVLRRSTGGFVLTDFGFSRVAGDSLRYLRAGTPGFLSPEQLCDAFGSVSPRTDVYGIGGILYFVVPEKACLSLA